MSEEMVSLTLTGINLLLWYMAQDTQHPGDLRWLYLEQNLFSQYWFIFITQSCPLSFSFVLISKKTIKPSLISMGICMCVKSVFSNSITAA